MELDPDILAYYDLGKEADRLRGGSASGPLELERTRELIDRHLPPGTLRILDVGGGPGVHAEWLVERGHDVTLVDPVPLHVAQATAAGIAAEDGDARALRFDAESFDVVLLLGPLYHLLAPEDRQQALREAHRVLRRGGTLFAAAISRYAALHDLLVRTDRLDADLLPVVTEAVETGVFRAGPVLFTTAYFHRPNELADEIAAAGFADPLVRNIEGPGFVVTDLAERWADPDRREVLLAAARLVESDPEAMAAAGHLLAVAEKPKADAEPFPQTSHSARIHPELRRRARVIPRHAVSARSLPVLRALTRPLTRVPVSGGEVATVGDLSVRVHRPKDAGAGPLPAVLWIHGGGYVIGVAAQDDGICRRLADGLGAIVAAVDYRLAPDHPFPTPLHDCHDALVWLAGRDDVDAGRVAVAGASAGGGLAAAVGLLARERGEVALVAQALSYPMVDDRTVLRTDLDERGQRLWTQRSNRFGWESYLGRPPGGDGVDPLAAPARAADLTGLPPTWIGVGTCDLFHDEDVAYARHLRSAGVDCTLLVVDGAYHAFDVAQGRSHLASVFNASQLDFLRGALAAAASV